MVARQRPRPTGDGEQTAGSERASDAVSAREAAAILGLHERTVRRAIHRGELAAIKEGRAFRITPEALDRFRAGRGDTARQVRLADRRGAPPVPFLGETRPAELALPLTRFVGRTGELAAAARLLRSPARLVTLVGPGGIGKTRLALELARSLRDDFADGAAFVSLAPVRSADLVMPAITRNLGVRLGGAQSALEQVAAFLRDRELLLVLDNVEQVTNAAPALSELLTACPRLTILATSRAPLRIMGEHPFAVPSLELPRDQSDGAMRSRSLDALAMVEAVALFVDRAQAASPGFAMTAENASIIAAICERTDGVPLAIELAAARTSVLSLTDLYDRLSHQLAILRGGPRDQPPRLRSMADAITWSYNLLSPDECALLRRLSVFVGGVSLDAAEDVGGKRGQEGRKGGKRHEPAAAPLSSPSSPSVLELLTALVDQSLLQRVAGPGDATRYAMLETVREYGLERLAESREEEAACMAHAAYFLAFAERADAELRGFQQAQWYNRLREEHANMRAALTWLRDRGDAERGLRLARALSRFWGARGFYAEARTWFDALLALPAAATPPSPPPVEGGVSPRTRAHADLELSSMARWQGDGERAAAFAEEALALFHGLDDPLGAGYALRCLASNALDLRTAAQAASFLEQSDALLASRGTPWDRAFGLYLAGRLADIRHDDKAAVARFAAAAEAFEAIGDRDFVAAALARLAAPSLRLGDHAAARAAYAGSLRIAAETNEWSWVAWALAGAARLALEEQKAPLAARFLGAASALRDTIGERHAWDGGLEADVRAALPANRFDKAWRLGLARPVAVAIRDALSSFESSQVRGRQPASASLGPSSLTTRERDVLRLLVEGLSDKEIAVALGIARYTASNHVTAIRDKLGVPSRAAVVAIAVREDLD